MRLRILPALALLAVPGIALAIQPSTIVHSEQERAPQLAVDAKGQIHLVAASVVPDQQAPDIFYSSSSDGGKTWTPRVNVSNTAGWSSEPQIAVNGDTVAIVWADTSSGEDHPDIFVSVSTDGGKKWRRGVDVSNTPGKSGEPVIAIGSDGTFHTLWLDTTPGQPDIFYSQSKDQGLTWTKAENVSKTPGRSNAPAIVCGAKGEVAVAWADVDGENPDIWFSLLSGKSWSKPVNLSNSPGKSANPSIAMDDQGGIYVAWSDTTPASDAPDIFLLVSHDLGKTFERSQNVSQTPGRSLDPEVAAAGNGQVAVVWSDVKNEEEPDIWMTTSNDAAKTFAAPVNVSNTAGISSAPDVVVANGHIYSVWDETGDGATRLRFVNAAFP